MHRKVKIILNPMADMGNAWRIARDLRSITEQHGGVDWSGTVYPGHAIELAKQAGEQGYDMVIAMGGDGTVHEVDQWIDEDFRRETTCSGGCPGRFGQRFCACESASPASQSDHALVHALNGEDLAVDLGLMTDEHGRTGIFR